MQKNLEVAAIENEIRITTYNKLNKNELIMQIISYLMAVDTSQW